MLLTRAELYGYEEKQGIIANQVVLIFNGSPEQLEYAEHRAEMYKANRQKPLVISRRDYDRLTQRNDNMDRDIQADMRRQIVKRAER